MSGLTTTLTNHNPLKFVTKMVYIQTSQTYKTGRGDTKYGEGTKVEQAIPPIIQILNFPFSLDGTWLH